MPSDCAKAVNSIWISLWTGFSLYKGSAAFDKSLTNQVLFAHFFSTALAALHTINTQFFGSTFYLLKSQFSLFSTQSITITNLIIKDLSYEFR